MEDERRQPVKKFRVGNVTASVWQNASGYSVTLQKSYKDEDEWKNSQVFFHSDVVCAINALERAEKFIAG
jgi:hypothetical protein